ncbi:uncharacterized protein LOC131008123 [Salvia miltiorrhiza]|uniref:uncharacterized protein LOC131008123 n=1 Tax=Salvia miltiorrhiza TaxID=226208 RepID=UPI0025AC3A40|nr:uncharacterized protein LOC131008123 [Salvia miltiorrhiza]
MPPRRVYRNVPVNEEEHREPTPPPPPQDRRVEELFLRQNPPTFAGTGDPAETEEWIHAMERIFRFLRCNDAERLMCVSYQLKGTADYWWEAKQKTMAPEQLDELTWELFKTALLEYDRLFCDLARYTPYRVDTDEKMSELFCAGLRQEIRVVLASQTALSYAEALNRALDMELAMQPEKTTHAPTPPSAQYTQVSNTPYSNQGQKGKRKWENRGNEGKKL